MSKRGVTAVVDAMFFILLIEMAVTVIAVANTAGDESGGGDASEVCDAIMMSNITLADFGFDPGDKTVHPVADMIAASMVLKDGNAADYLSKVLRQLYPRNGGYRMTVGLTDREGGSRTLAVGSGNGDAEAEYSGAYAVTFGGKLDVRLELY